MNTRHPSTYDTDFFAWTQDQAAHLRAGRARGIDLENLAEEIDDLARRVHDSLDSRMQLLIAHLLKWQYQPDHRTHSWQRTIAEQRRRIQRMVRKTPSLQVCLRDPLWLAEGWHDAVDVAADDTRLSNLPHDPLWPVDALLDPRFWPERRRRQP